MAHKRHRSRIGVGIAAAVGAATAAFALPTPAAAAATHISLDNGVLTINGSNKADTVVVSRDAAGNILVNGRTIPKIRPTVTNVNLITILGRGADDTLALDEANGALPAANILGGDGNDTLTGGSGNDQLSGQAGNDTISGRAGADTLDGGSGNDTLTGGDGDDQVSGGDGDDRMVWNPGDDTDLNEGGAGQDTVEVNGGNGSEDFTATANGTRVRFDRLQPAPFSLDIGTSEELTLNANGGDDTFSATGNLASLIHLTVNGGPGNDTLRGGNGADILNGGDGNDFVDGNQGSDAALLGTGDDTFEWDPGDGSDSVEGQDGADTMLFNGANIAEKIDISANGSRVRLTRDVGAIVMDINGVERADVRALGGADQVTVNDLTGTGLTETDVDLAGSDGAPDAAADNVIVNGTGGNDVITASGSPAPNVVTVSGLPTLVDITGTDGPADGLTIQALAGDDVVDASALAAGAVTLRGDGAEGDDVIIGSSGDDILLGGPGDDVLIGGPGQDQLDGGPGDNILLQ